MYFFSFFPRTLSFFFFSLCLLAASPRGLHRSCSFVNLSGKIRVMEQIIEKSCWLMFTLPVCWPLWLSSADTLNTVDFESKVIQVVAQVLFAVSFLLLSSDFCARSLRFASTKSMSHSNQMRLYTWFLFFQAPRAL